MIRHLYNESSHIFASASLLVSVSAEHCMFLWSIPELTAFRSLYSHVSPMPSNMFQYNLKYMYGLESYAFWKNQIVAMGAKLDIRIEWFKQFWMSMLPLSLKPSLYSIWRRDGKRWSLKDIKMATMVVILYIPMEQV